jgi:ribosomal protein S18 acetylase RimI-like enzyme
MKSNPVHDSKFAVRELEMRDYDFVQKLWRSVEGLSLGESDSPENIERYLLRNPGLSFTAWHGDQLIGAVLCGHDGRRAFLHHLAVVPEYRNQGVARQLVERCLTVLRNHGIRRCHVFVLRSNDDGHRFWQRIGWKDREDIALMTRDTPAG